MPPKRPCFKKRPTSNQIAAAKQTTPPDIAVELSIPIMESVVQPPPAVLESSIKKNQEWFPFLNLMDVSCVAASHQPFVNAMHLIASVYNVNPNDKELLIGNIVVRRTGAKITGHHREQPSLTFDMTESSQPILWVEMVKRFFAERRIHPPPKPSPTPATSQWQLVMKLLAKLPVIKKLVIWSERCGEIILNVIGKTFNAIVRVVGDRIHEDRRYTQLCVPWRDAPQANPALGTQIIMIPPGATKIHIEIVPTASGGYIGNHCYGVGGLLCLSLPNAMAKYRINKPMLIHLDYINPSLVVIKQPHSSFHGVIECIEMKSRTGVIIGEKQYAWTELDNLDAVLADFANDGNL